jgi:hypothetical protein
MAQTQLSRKAPQDQPFTPSGTGFSDGEVAAPACLAPQWGQAGAVSWICLPQPRQKIMDMVSSEKKNQEISATAKQAIHTMK